MSDSNGPVRRRRIAGESSPGTPPKKPVVKKPVAKKAAVKKAATSKAVPKKTPVARKTPDKKTPVAKKAPAPKPSEGTIPTPAVKPGVKRPTAQPAPERRTTPVVPVATRRPTSSPDAPREGRSGRSRRDLLVLAPLTLVAAAALVLGVFWIVDPPGSSGDGALDSSRRQASAAAGSAAETIFSFRFDQLDDHLAASKALMTPAFAKDFDEIAPALTELAPQRNIVVQAVTRESAALPCGDECSDTKADVLVFIDQARLIGDSTEPTVFANRIKVSMVKGDDGWLVSDIRAL